MRLAAPPRGIWSTVPVVVDPSTTFQTMAGFGTSERSFYDPHTTQTNNGQNPATGTAFPPLSEQNAIYDLLYLPANLGLTRIRYTTDPGFVEVADTDTYDFSAPRAMSYHTDYVTAARARAPMVWYGSPIYPENWMSRSDPVEMAEWAFAVISEWNNRGLPLPYWSMANEPSFEGGGVTISGATIRDAIKLLGPMLTGAGLTTKIVIPDDVNPTAANSLAATILADATARSYVGAISYHIYGAESPAAIANLTGLAALVATAATYNMPLWMSEWTCAGTWQVYMQAIFDTIVSYNTSAFDLFVGFFGDWTAADGIDYIQINITAQGFNGQFVDYTIQKKYYVMQQWSKYVRPGMVRIAATVTGAVQVAAFQGVGYMTVVLYNTGATVTVSLQGVIGTFVDGQRTSASENGVAVDPTALNRLPAGSITTLRYRS